MRMNTQSNGNLVYYQKRGGCESCNQVELLVLVLLSGLVMVFLSSGQPARIIGELYYSFTFSVVYHFLNHTGLNHFGRVATQEG